MFLNALLEVSAGIPDIVCIAQTTLVMVNHALLVNDRRLLFFRFDPMSDLTACIHGANINSNVADSDRRSIYVTICSRGNWFARNFLSDKIVS